ncbi:MAG: hypothetical protein PHU12_02095 [Candidatus Aenigmarchaeota archaeon]|nr:hypothetical protein [Candidatus Aenigmarchaeota archaeon]
MIETILLELVVGALFGIIGSVFAQMMIENWKIKEKPAKKDIEKMYKLSTYIFVFVVIIVVLLAMQIELPLLGFILLATLFVVI